MYTVYDLTIEQMQELKQDYLFASLEEVEGRSPSWYEIANANEIVPDWIIFDNYSRVIFTDDDFSCTAGDIT
jgi:hypothetical protein